MSTGASERAFSSMRKETPPASNVSRAGLTPRMSFPNDPLASSRATVASSF